ncbi:MAG: NAD-dependent epimerase/dehydratase family protein [Gemmatimonadales bacterium]
MKAFVTGGTGFVGGHLVRALRARGDDVTALVRTPARATALSALGATLVEGDIQSPRTVAEAIKDHDVVFHVAGLIAARSEAEFLAVNREGTGVMVEAAERSGRPRFILVSSLAAGGPTAPGVRLVGTEPGAPVTRYGRSKLAGEEMVRASDLPWTIVRPPAVYGPGDREMFRIFKAATLGIAPVFGRGDQQLSVVYGPDLVEALIATSLAPATVGQVYYACHREILTTREMVGLAAAAVGRRVRIVGIPQSIGRALLTVTDRAARLFDRATVLSYDKAAEFFAPAWLADPGPLEVASGWTAQHDFATGARATVAWYRQQGWL